MTIAILHGLSPDILEHAKAGLPRIKADESLADVIDKLATTNSEAYELWRALRGFYRTHIHGRIADRYRVDANAQGTVIAAYSQALEEAAVVSRQIAELGAELRKACRLGPDESLTP